MSILRIYGYLQTAEQTSLIFNATITQETSWCTVCNKDTIMLTYRTPEYTKSGTTALNRGVNFRTEQWLTEKQRAILITDGRIRTPSYTTYHWTKSVCQTCGTINSVDGRDAYGFSRNVYGLNSCDHNFSWTLTIPPTPHTVKAIIQRY